MEEGNIKEHRNYLVLEEEKRKKARLVRTAVEGPLLRVVSKAETITVKIQPEPVPMPPPAPPQYTHAYHGSQLPPGFLQLAPPEHSVQYMPAPPPPPPPGSSTSPMAFVHHYDQQQPAVGPSSWTPQQLMGPPPPPPQPEPIERPETVAKNYVVYEMSQEEDASKPLWKDTMSAMFGDHVKWEDLKMYSGKGRPTSKHSLRSICISEKLSNNPRRSSSRHLPDYGTSGKISRPKNGRAICKRASIPDAYQGACPRLHVERELGLLCLLPRGRRAAHGWCSVWVSVTHCRYI